MTPMIIRATSATVQGITVRQTKNITAFREGSRQFIAIVAFRIRRISISTTPMA